MQEEVDVVAKWIIDLDTSKCCACGACAIACMDQNDIDIPAKERPLRNVFEYEEHKASGAKFAYLSMACMHCDDAPCIIACPCGCIEKDEETGMTIYDNTGCIGCHSCSMACPFAAPSFDKHGKMIKCDGCSERLKFGLKPSCVNACPAAALKCVTEDEYNSTQQAKSLHSVIKAIL